MSIFLKEQRYFRNNDLNHHIEKSADDEILLLNLWTYIENLNATMTTILIEIVLSNLRLRF